MIPFLRPPTLQLDYDPADYRAGRHARPYPRTRRMAARLARALRFQKAVAVGAVGGDVSKWQTFVDWPKAAAGTPEEAPGWQFVGVRWLFGTQVDIRAATHWAGAGAQGLKRMPYAYYLDALDPYVQAQKLFQVVSDAGMGELPPVGDFEEISNAQLTPAKVKDYLEALADLFPEVPIVYTGKAVWDRWIGNVSWAALYELWLAQYTLVGWQPPRHLEKVKNYPPSVPKPWTTWGIWQVTASCPAALYGVAGNVVDVDFASPEFWSRHGGSTPPPTPGEDEMKTAHVIFPYAFNARAKPTTASLDVGDFQPGDTVTHYPADDVIVTPGVEEWWHLKKADKTVCWGAKWHPSLKVDGKQVPALADV